jgi:hypothetical protein
MVNRLTPNHQTAHLCPVIYIYITENAFEKKKLISV